MSTADTMPKTTTAFFVQAGIAFAVSFVGLGVGIAYLPLDPWQRAFLAMGALFLTTSVFTLAKCVRDFQESGTIVSRIDEARREKLMAEHDPFRSPKPFAA